MRLRSLFITLGTTIALGAVALGASVLVSACADDTTTGKRISLETRVVADDGIDAPFTNAYGWSIQLTQAALSIGGLYYFDGAPIFSASRSRALPRQSGDWFGVRVAHAHPGHYQEGNARGQMLSPGSFDLAAGESTLATGEGTTGFFRSGRFVYGDKPTGAAASVLGSNVVVIVGKATKDTMTRVFRASASVADVLDSDGEAELDGCAFSNEPEVQADGTVTLHVKPSVWLDQAELDDVPESADGSPVDLTPDEEAFKAFVRGLKKGSSMVFSYAQN